MNLKKKKFFFNKKDLEKFYYFYFIYFNNSNFYPKYNEFNLKTNKWDKYWSVDYYDFWVNNFSKKTHQEMLNKIKDFIKSREYCLS